MYTTIPLVLPVLALPQVRQQARCSRLAWDQHTDVAWLNAVFAFRIRERAKMHKITPMHFYITTYHVLLGRLAGRNAEEICVGIADTNRATVKDVVRDGLLRLPPSRPHGPVSSFCGPARGNEGPPAPGHPKCARALKREVGDPGHWPLSAHTRAPLPGRLRLQAGRGRERYN